MAVACTSARVTSFRITIQTPSWEPRFGAASSDNLRAFVLIRTTGRNEANRLIERVWMPAHGTADQKGQDETLRSAPTSASPGPDVSGCEVAFSLASAMHTSPTLPCDAVMPELDEPRIRPTSDSPPEGSDPAEDDPAPGAGSQERIAAGMDATTWSTGCSAELEAALGADGRETVAAAKVRKAIGELDLAIRDFRNVLFDHQVMSRRSRLLGVTRVGWSTAFTGPSSVHFPS